MAKHLDAREVIAPLLEPGETLLWHANGRGPHWIPHNIFGLIFASVCAAMLAGAATLSFINGEASVGLLVYGLVITAGVTIILVSTLIHAIFSPGRDCYGLTDRRVIVVWRSWPARTRSYSASNISAFRLRDGKTGDIAFWTQPKRFVNRSWAIVGIDEPRRIADLIKTSLRLDLPLEIVNPSLRIPPLKPRTP